MKAPKKLKTNLLGIEKLIYGGAMLMTLVFIVFVVFSKATLSQMNIEVERLKIEVAETENRIESISMKINELASLENVSMVATEMGLSYNNNKVIVIK